jgi:hypothetical protein
MSGRHASPIAGRAYRRGDVDELLDLSDQLAKAQNEVEQLQAAVSKIAQAAPR